VSGPGGWDGEGPRPIEDKVLGLLEAVNRLLAGDPSNRNLQGQAWAYSSVLDYILLEKESAEIRANFPLKPKVEQPDQEARIKALEDRLDTLENRVDWVDSGS